MRRRDFIIAVGASGIVIFGATWIATRHLDRIGPWPLAVEAQQPVVPVIGLLGSGRIESFASRIAALMGGLKEAGFIEHQNLGIEQRWANDQYDRLPELAASLVRARVSLLVAFSNYPSAAAAKAATSTIPIVFLTGADPVATGLVASLNRPGGNVTGIAAVTVEITPKRFQLLRYLLPDARRFGILVNPDNVSGESALHFAENAVHALGGTLEIAYAKTARDFDAAFAHFVERRVEAIATVSDSLFLSERARIVELTARYAIPMIHSSTEITRDGGLMSYVPDTEDIYRQAGLYAGRILKGEKPADLPVMQPTKFKFVLNLKTAKALGIEVPPQLLAITDDVIE